MADENPWIRESAVPDAVRPITADAETGTGRPAEDDSRAETRSPEARSAETRSRQTGRPETRSAETRSAETRSAEAPVVVLGTAEEESPPAAPDRAQRRESDELDRSAREGARFPQSGVPELEAADRLPRRPSSWPATVWWLGTHGGSGESTLAALAPGTRAAGHAWPISLADEPPHRVVLVARTSYSGLASAQRAARDWASGALQGDADVVGLLLLADAPGRLPRPLRDLAALVSGGVPRSWMLPWYESWRLPEPGPAPAAVASVVAELTGARPAAIPTGSAFVATPSLRGT